MSNRPELIQKLLRNADYYVHRDAAAAELLTAAAAELIGTGQAITSAEIDLQRAVRAYLSLQAPTIRRDLLERARLGEPGNSLMNVITGAIRVCFARGLDPAP